MLLQAADALGDLRDKVMFVGGAITSVLITDPAAPEVRPTTDVDTVVEIANLVDYYRIEEELRNRGFEHDMESKHSGRFVHGSLKMDISAIGAEVVGDVNTWYRPAFGNAIGIRLTSEFTILCITAPYFLASKLEAFRNRGNNDFFESQDIEDIVRILDGRPQIVAEIGESESNVRYFLRQEFSKLIADDRFREALVIHLRPDEATPERQEDMLAIVLQVANL